MAIDYDLAYLHVRASKITGAYSKEQSHGDGSK
jgi:hypothetical protein